MPQTKTRTCTCIVAAAGSSRRNGGEDKLFAPLCGRPVLWQTLSALNSAPSVQDFVIVTRECSLDRVKALCEEVLTKPYTVILGGSTRAESVRLGLSVALQPLVAIHDGARPLVSVSDIEAVIAEAAECGAATLATPARDTVKSVTEGIIRETPDRSLLWNAQTPQVFDRSLLIRGYDGLLTRGDVPTDDCSAAEAAGAKVHIVEGSPRNIKITTPEDFIIARAFLDMPAFRIGHGYDVHRLVEGRKLILGGIDIPYEKGLLGHSDADVLTHAVADALLGALALGDIGKHFPDNDPAYAGADSLKLLSHVAALCREHGYRASSVDATVLCQRPKLAPHIAGMRERIATAIGISSDLVSVKATTEEGLGFTGEGAGIAAHAVCMMELL